MMKPLLLAAAALALPVSAHADATASVQLFSNAVTFNFTGPATPTGGNVFSLNSAALNGGGNNTAASMMIPGTADAAIATDGTISADSFITVGATDGSFATSANGSVANGDFGSGTGRVTSSLEFATSIVDTSLTIILDLTRVFSLTSDNVGDSASGRTGLSIGILDSSGLELLPTITFSSPLCAPNFTVTAANGNDFSDSCTTTATFAFAPLAIGAYTLTFGASSNIDVVAARDVVDTPEPGMIALLGLGLTAVAAKRRRRA